MPRFLMSPGAKGGFINSDWMIQLDNGVGRGKANLADDVVIVQFFLEATRSKWGGAKEVKRDGNCGTITMDSIKAFQEWAKRSFSAQLTADGTVDPLPSGGMSVVRTLGWLHQIYVANNPNAFPAINRHQAYISGRGAKGLFI